LAVTKPARLYVTEAIIDEYWEMMARRRMNIPKGRRQQLLQLIRNRAYTVSPARALQVTPDSDDNMFLECADAARADYLVTGNQRHFPRVLEENQGDHIAGVPWYCGPASNPVNEIAQKEAATGRSCSGLNSHVDSVQRRPPL
jgi:putative PIN family toxin of toxin-antitoxin system